VAGKQHERELARARAARARQREEARQRKRTRVALGVVGGVLAVSLIAGVALAVTGGDDETPTASGTPAATSTSDAETNDSNTDDDAPSGSPTFGALEDCKPVNDKQPGNPDVDSYAKAVLNTWADYSEAITTNCGGIKVELFDDDAPETVKALTWLSDAENYYNNTICHRLTTDGIFVLQCGDPEGTGSGGPDFTVPDENLPEAGPDGTAVYERGTMAMANRGPGTTGSQFFLVYQDSPLPPDYTVVGQIVEGLDVLDKIAREGTEDGSTDGPPKQPVQITKMVASYTTAVED
jgi:peptidyl-prolyl cis-trans isomerase B (cyclophilin B)